MKYKIIMLITMLCLMTGCTIPGTNMEVHGIDAFCPGQVENTCKVNPDCKWEDNECKKSRE